MRDPSVNVWNTTTISADGATNGPTIDLLEDYVGDHQYGTSMYGLPVEILADDIVAGTDADGWTLTWKWQVAADDGAGSPDTWIDHTQIGVIATDSDIAFTKDGTITGDALGLDRAKLQTRLRTAKRFARLVCTAADVEGSSTVRTRAWLTDGTLCFADTAVIS